jgi:hypothetical protein
MTHECRRKRSRQRKDPGRREDVGEIERDYCRGRRKDDDRIGHTQVVPGGGEDVTQQSSRHHARREEGEQGRETRGGKGDTEEPNGEHEPADPARVIRPRRSGRDVLPHEIRCSERQRDGEDEGASRHTWNVADRRYSPWGNLPQADAEPLGSELMAESGSERPEPLVLARLAEVGVRRCSA